MSGTGRVVTVDAASVPATNASARKVIVERADGTQTAFFVPLGNDPVLGSMISWGPHHAWNDTGWRVKKLTWEEDPNAPLR